MRKIKESNVALPGFTTTVDSSTQTPIEIALKIDENGMTSLKNLYTFLEINPSNYSKWCRRNIINNPFAVENIDYIPIRIHDENHTGGRPTYDYKLTSDFAKQLSMTVKNERGQQARQYFIACEQGLKVASEKLQESTSKLNEKFVNAIENINTTLSAIDTRLLKLEEQSAKKKLPEKKYSRWKTKTFARLSTLNSYVNKHSDEPLKLSEIIHLVIAETEDSYNIEVNDYMDAYKSEFDLEPNQYVYVLDVINHYKDIRDMFSLTLDSIMEKLHIDEDPNHNRTGNIFDELAAKADSEKLEDK